MKLSEMDMKKFQVTGDRILLKKEVKNKEGFEKRESGLFVATNSEQSGPADNLAEIVQVGPDVETKGSGNSGSLRIVTGAFALYQPYAGFKFENGDNEYIIISEAEVMGVVEQK